MRLGDTEWVEVASFHTIPEAAVARGRLEAEGIPCMVADEHLVQADWLYAIALGGIRLRVPAAQASRARCILATDHSDLLEAPDGGGDGGEG